MAERERRSELVRAGPPVRVGSVTFLAVERVQVRSIGGGAGVWASAVLEPCAIVVRDAGGVRAVGVDGRAVSLERLRELIPGLDAPLAGA